MDGTFRCRKCGCFLFAAENLVSDQSVEHEQTSGFTQWFLRHEFCPDWAEQAILKEQYTRGKLICPKCNGRVGAFDFVGKRENFQLGPVWVQKCRVDLVKHIHVPPVPKRSQVNLPLHKESSSSQGTYIDTDLLTLRDDIEVVPLPSISSNSEASSSRLNRTQDKGLNGDVDGVDIDRNHLDARDDEGGAGVKDQLSPSRRVSHGSRFTPLALDPKLQENLPVEQEVPPEEPDDTPVVSEAESAYTCPICLDVLFQAHTCRPCLHVYCAPCLRRLCGASPFNTKCPLCRQVIAACLPNHEMSNIVKTVFPKEYNQRKAMEKKNRKKLPPLPSSGSFTFTRFNRDRNRNYVLIHWAGVCFVVLLIVMAISILATTVGMLLWYLWETFMDYFIDGLVSVNGYFDYSWQLIIMILLEKSDEISPELAKMLAGSFGQVLHAVGKLFNRSVENPLDFSVLNTAGPEESSSSESAAQINYVISAFQVDLANYILVMCVVTYLIYRFARYRQARQVEATQLR